MSKPSITIGISVYDRINDSKVAALLAKTVLAAYVEVKVVVAACKPDTKRELENIEYIDFVLEPNIPKETPLEFNIHSNLGAARTFSSFLKCGNYAQKNQTDYYCFGNAGSWLLGPDGIIELTSKLNKGNKLAACRVAREGRKYLVEDHFFLVNLKISKDQQIFNGKFYDRFFNPIFFYDNGIHSLLENWINLKTEPGQVIIYSDLTDCKNHFGDPVNSFVPFSLDLKKNFIHSNNEFPKFAIFGYGDSRMLFNLNVKIKKLIKKEKFEIRIIGMDNRGIKDFSWVNCPKKGKTLTRVEMERLIVDIDYFLILYKHLIVYFY